MRMNLEEISKKKLSSITEDPGWAYSRAWLEDAANQCKATAVPFLVALDRGKDEKFLADLNSSGIDAISLEQLGKRLRRKNVTAVALTRIRALPSMPKWRSFSWRHYKSGAGLRLHPMMVAT